jgi:hypothetical protein
MSTPPTLDIVDERGEIHELVVRLRRAEGMLEAWLSAERPFGTAAQIRKRAMGMIATGDARLEREKAEESRVHYD